MSEVGTRVAQATAENALQRFVRLLQLPQPGLRLRDGNTTCNDGSRWYADQLVCRRGADDVAHDLAQRQGA